MFVKKLLLKLLCFQQAGDASEDGKNSTLVRRALLQKIRKLVHY
ncbi:hypothetical protein NSMM_760001 [Nitrosomonas mobilis]|uniref:Uncharacterized protein n=1 Tax=Nitrosomonas mobilis TaxID=51642 RepID=A0A1G5SJQ5_9PROT|nr:hypothetical protein NSMM_760001 [Nitrosomonas mobilis]